MPELRHPTTAGDLYPGDHVRIYGTVWRTVRTIELWGPRHLKIRYTNGAEHVFPAWKRLDIERGDADAHGDLG